MKKTVIFVHGMYMTSLCWEGWLGDFSRRGYACTAPDWPDRDDGVQARRQAWPDARTGGLTLTRVVEHFRGIIKALPEKPVLVGHSMGGLVVQLLVAEGLASAAVMIDSAPPMGVFTTRFSFLKANWPHITPFARQSLPVQMGFGRFCYAFVNGLPEPQQRAAFDRFVVPESRLVPREAVFAKINFKAAHVPLLFVAGEKDNIIPAPLNRSNAAAYRHAESVCDYLEFAGRTHFIIGQDGWPEVAEAVDHWIGRH